jgi:hypothetical protein
MILEENVAYDTTGDCFVLSTGTENRIILRRNVGAKTRKRDTNDRPATFFIAEMNTNQIEYNVAAGSEGDGFKLLVENSCWEKTNNSSIVTDVVHTLVGNVAHSNNMVRKGWA